jgi:glycosyltransferase involved in cell wall biosynthesis
VFTYYHLNINSNSNLFLLGKYSTSENYFKTISKLISDLKIKNIHFVENPDIEKLSNYYSISTLLLILSEHEGFCVPLVESMHFKIPIFALNSTAIPYTLGNSGVLINDENFEEIAELINLVLVNDNLKNSIIAKQTFQLNSMYKNIKKLLSNMINQVK